MTQDIKNEATEQVELEVKFGFETEEEIIDNIVDMFYDEDDFDEDWLREIVAQQYRRRQEESLSWTKPTDFDRLAKTFDDLALQKIVCLHNAGYTKQDAQSDCMETIERLDQSGVKAAGFCYYHSQDLGRAVDPGVRNLYLGFDSATQDDDEALEIAGTIVAELMKNGFTVSWPGTVEQRIEIKDINWNKIPDGQEWGAERVIQILTKPGAGSKPFWKIW